MKKYLASFRRIIQIITFIFFFILVVGASEATILNIPTSLLNKMSPLLGIVTLIAARTLVISLLFFLPIIILTLIFGRVFCGWICPLGTLNNLFSYIKVKLTGRYRTKVHNNRTLRKFKYVVLAVVVLASIFSVQIAGWVDPLSIFSRGAALVIVPSIQYPVDAINNNISQSYENRKEEILNEFKEGKISKEERAEQLTKVLEEGKDFREFRRNLENNFLYEKANTYFEHALIHISIFLGILLLNFLASRFWCNYVCPLGALLSLFSRISLLKIKIDKSKCSMCKLCDVYTCGACSPYREDNNDDNERMYCFNCVNQCDKGAINVRLEVPEIFKKNKDNKEVKDKKHKAIDKAGFKASRRQLTKSVVAGVAGISVIGLGAYLSPKQVIRPPGVIDEATFIDKCVRCGLCVRTCPTNFLQISLAESGVKGLFTPIGVAGTGYCEHTCNKCGQVCPTGAIPNLPLEEKQKMKMGVAVFDRGNCLPWAKDTQCIVCEEHCPVSPKAIYTKDVMVKDRYGMEIPLKRPYTDPNLCIGCGICSYKCIADSKPAINVFPLKEETSHKTG